MQHRRQARDMARVQDRAGQRTADAAQGSAGARQIKTHSGILFRRRSLSVLESSYSDVSEGVDHPAGIDPDTSHQWDYRLLRDFDASGYDGRDDTYTHLRPHET